MLAILLTLLIILIAGYLMYNLLNATTGLSVHVMTRRGQISSVNKQKAKRVKTRRSILNTVEKLHNSYQNISFLKVTKESKKKMEYYALRLDFEVSGVKMGHKFIHVIKSTITIVYIAVIILIGMFHVNMFVLLVFFPFIYSVPDWYFDFKIAYKNKKIEAEFNDFYSEFYYSLIHKQNRGVALKDLAMRYRYRAGPEMVTLIDGFRADCAQSEKIALANLKENYRLADIHKFVDRVSLVINGQGNAVQAMTKFKDELDHRRRMHMREQVEKSKVKAKQVEVVVYAILGEIVLAYSAYNLLTTVAPAFNK